jgi:hypothetical protein
MMRYRGKTCVWMLVLWLTLTPTLSVPARAEDTGAKAAGSIGWALTFHFDAKNDGKLDGQFHYMLKYQDSPAAYELAGSVSIPCEPNLLAAFSHQCSVPDMAALIFEASHGEVDIRQMLLPAGTLEVCGQMAANLSPASVEIITTDSPKLYELRLAGQTLTLSHAQREADVVLSRSTGRFHLTLPDTPLTAPTAYTLNFEHAPHLYHIDTLTVADPGAFAHLAAECSGY